MSDRLSKMSKKSSFGELNVQKRPYLDISIAFSEGPEWHFSDFRMHFSGFRGSVGGQDRAIASQVGLSNSLGDSFVAKSIHFTERRGPRPQPESIPLKPKIPSAQPGLLPGCSKISRPQSITQKGVHTHPLTAREREHWFLQHLSHFLAANFGRQ